jgi:SAM-dependent methyltransferase
LLSDDDLAGKEVLDIGCGFGWCELHLLERGVRQVTALEVSERDLETAVRWISDERVKFAVGSATALPLPSASVDTAVAWEVIEHLAGKAEPMMFGEARRVLRPGGAFYLSTPYDSLLSKSLDPAWWLCGHRHYSAAGLASLAREHGFAVEEMRVRGGIWSLAAALDMYVSKWILRRPPLWERFFREREQREYDRGNGVATIFIKLRKRR